MIYYIILFFGQELEFPLKIQECSKKINKEVT